MSIYAPPIGNATITNSMNSTRKGTLSYVDAVMCRTIPYEIIPTTALRQIYIDFGRTVVLFSFTSPFTGPEPSTIPIPFSMLIDFPSEDDDVLNHPDIRVTLPESGPDPSTIPIPFSMLSRDIQVQCNLPFSESNPEMMRIMRSRKRSAFWADEESDDEE